MRMGERMKLIALDMDETLLSTDGTLSQGNRQALLKAMECGIEVVIATGRVESALPGDVLELPGLRYAVTSNGARVLDLKNGRELYRNCIDWECLKPVLPELVGGQRLIEVFAEGRVYAPRAFMEDPTAFGVPAYRVPYIRNSRIPVADIDEVLYDRRDRLESINLCYADQEQREGDRELLSRFSGLTVTSSMSYNLEIGGGTASKADGLAQLCTVLGIRPAEVMACGDSGNDIEMLRFAGLSVAMGNAGGEVKQAARFVTLSNDRDGVAAAIQTHLFLG